MSEGRYVSRLHASKAHELRARTTFEKKTPLANGRAEAAVKRVKAAVKRLLTVMNIRSCCPCLRGD